LDFLELMEVRGVTNEITDLANYDDYWETEKDDYLKREEGISRLTYETSKGKQELILTRRLAKEINPDTKQEETITQMITDWPNEYWWGGYRHTN
jgi:hypothetical protein